MFDRPSEPQVQSADNALTEWNQGERVLIEGSTGEISAAATSDFPGLTCSGDCVYQSNGASLEVSGFARFDDGRVAVANNGFIAILNADLEEQVSFGLDGGTEACRWDISFADFVLASCTSSNVVIPRTPLTATEIDASAGLPTAIPIDLTVAINGAPPETVSTELVIDDTSYFVTEEGILGFAASLGSAPIRAMVNLQYDDALSYVVSADSGTLGGAQCEEISIEIELPIGATTPRSITGQAQCNGAQALIFG